MRKWLQLDMRAKLEFGIEVQSRKQSNSYLLSTLRYSFYDYS